MSIVIEDTTNLRVFDLAYEIILSFMSDFKESTKISLKVYSIIEENYLK